MYDKAQECFVGRRKNILKLKRDDEIFEIAARS